MVPAVELGLYPFLQRIAFIEQVAVLVNLLLNLFAQLELGVVELSVASELGVLPLRLIVF